MPSQGRNSGGRERHMRRAKSFIQVPVVVALLLCFSSAPIEAQNKKVVRISGAGALSDIVQTYSEGYMKKAADCSITVTGTSTGSGFQKLFAAGADLVMASRKISPEEAKTAEEKGIQLGSKYIGRVEIAIITNDKNTVDVLTMEQLAKIFKGEITNWKEVGGSDQPIKVTARAVPESGVGTLFQDVVLKGAPYAKSHVVMSSYITTLMVCGKSPAIGYIPTATSYFDRIGERGVKIIHLKKQADSSPYPLASGVAKETLYPISVPFFLYWNMKSENTCIKGFAEYAEEEAE
jgi:phosphate transport system substrate-binding protein